MALVTGSITVQCSTLDEFNRVLNTISNDNRVSNIQQDQVNLKLIFNITES